MLAGSTDWRHRRQRLSGRSASTKPNDRQATRRGARRRLIALVPRLVLIFSCSSDQPTRFWLRNFSEACHSLLRGPSASCCTQAEGRAIHRRAVAPPINFLRVVPEVQAFIRARIADGYRSFRSEGPKGRNRKERCSSGLNDHPARPLGGPDDRSIVRRPTADRTVSTPPGSRPGRQNPDSNCSIPG